MGAEGAGTRFDRTDRSLSEARFRALVQNSSDVILIMGEDSTIQYATPSVRTVFGYEPDDLLGTNGMRFVHPDDLEVTADHLAHVLAEPDRSQTSVVRARHADGSWRWIEAVVINKLGDPNVEGVVANMRDITERKRAEDALRESEARFRAVVQNSRDVIGLLDTEGRIAWISPTIAELAGYAPEDVIGQSGFDFVHPDDLDRASATLTRTVSDPTPSEPITILVRHRTDDWVHVEVAGSQLADENGLVVGVIMNLRDVGWRVDAEAALRQSEAMFRTLAESAPLGIFTADRHGNCLWLNQRWSDITGLSFAEGSGAGWQRMVHPDDLALLGFGDGREPEVTRPFSATFRLIRPDGTQRWVTTRLAPVEGPPGSGVEVVGTLDDITERVLAERDTARLTEIFEATHDLVGIAERDGTLLYVNRAARSVFDLPDHGGLEGANLLDQFPSWIARRIVDEIVPQLERDGVWTGELALDRGGSEPIPVLAQLLRHTDEQGNFEFFSGVMRDISERKRYEDQLAHQATHDPLTGLPNRVLLLEKLDRAVHRAQARDRAVGVLFLDLDHFKVVNDSLGHSVGDRLLIELSHRLRDAVRPDDLIARFGGDEFVVLCEDLDGEADAVAIARRVRDSVSGSFDIADADVYIGLSIGIAMSTADTADAETLIRDADAAMYRAKDKGRARWEIFDSAMRASAVDRLDIETALRRTLERRELRVYYQPILDLATDQITGVEALLRWEHPDRGLLLPGDFINIAEETGLIVPIGRWVLGQACRQVQRWQASLDDGRRLSVSVNLSGRQLGHPDLVDDVEWTLAEAGLDASQLQLEITESVLMDDVEMSDVTLGRLKELGVQVVVDDFGTGYSSLSYLRQFPVDVLKIDRSFVAGIDRDSGDSAIAAAIVNLAHTLGLRAVAEGVESPTQLVELRRMACDDAQGFHLARPGDSETVGELLRTPTPG